MTKQKEQLEEVVETVPEEKVSEEPASESVETPTEEVKEEIKDEEPSVEEKIEKVDDLDENTEQLSLEIIETREELAVIKEVRDELVKLYSNYKQVEQLKENAVSENEQLKKDVEMLSAKIHDYKIAEEKLEAEQKLHRLEQLSAKFTALGQSKSVEYLSSKDSEILSEFEKIVDAALLKVGDTSELPSVTNNTQAEKLNEAVTSNEEIKATVAQPAKPKEQLSNEDFFAGICNTLSGKQNGADGKRITLM